jgi:hypothetical protein
VGYLWKHEVKAVAGLICDTNSVMDFFFFIVYFTAAVSCFCYNLLQCQHFRIAYTNAY